MTDAALFLSREQLLDLTGYRQPRAQVEWLQKNGVLHWVRADGRPSVPLSAITDPPVRVTGAAEFTPNFDALRLTN